ncbi:sensor histidine kinase [Rhizohabitans arisaemae]|uniref:sensor histidine kinase n=1 Tax=Rhizohabitans arisaemae TaxID=2720610 RepID=UPI0024B14884|nr:HAMP domain-containing sensor histidine kinase [Rhizohabitans arisaemae]
MSVYLWPRSIRGRITLIVGVITALLLIPLTIGVDLTVRDVITRHIFNDAHLAAARTSTAIPAMISRIPETVHGINLIQVVDKDGRVIAASKDASPVKPMNTVRPSATDGTWNLLTCDNGTCLMLAAVRVNVGPDSPVVYAGKVRPPILAGGFIEAVSVAAAAALTGLVSWFTWAVTGRTLGPVRAIRAQLAEINESDLSRRVYQPPGEDEVALLARTANATLDRLERAAEHQRRFASDASHELRSPITGLRLELEDALDHPYDTDLIATLKAALRDTERLEAIVTDLLLMARISTGGVADKERIDLAELVAAELGTRHPQVEIRTRLVKGTDVVCARMQIARVVTNLMDNAERHARGLVEVEVRPDGPFGLLSVTDDGSGIPPEDRERVFERFVRLDEGWRLDERGSGLGLAIAHDIAAAHQGTLKVEDGPAGWGARFVLRLPLVRESARG